MTFRKTEPDASALRLMGLTEPDASALRLMGLTEPDASALRLMRLNLVGRYEGGAYESDHVLDKTVLVLFAFRARLV